ncbi:MAG: site-specific DNA-methyltransferase [Porticoccaceae bacterium]
MAKKPKAPVRIETLTHADATRKNIPTAEYQSVVDEQTRTPIQVAYERRNKDLDPQLVWRGKDIQDWSDPGSAAGASLVVHAPPIYIQEKIHPKVLIDDLRRQTEQAAAGHAAQQAGAMVDMFADFNGLPDTADKTDFYQHDAHWSNRMILGDSLQVMASLAEREGLRGQVQCIYFDPPYGIKFNSNFQWSTTSRDVKDGNADHITREPEQVKAFRDTWRDGIHSYLTYLRDRLTVARDLLTDSGSIFVQIGDENVHRVRAVMDEVFGEGNLCAEIVVQKTSSASGPSAVNDVLPSVADYILWYARDRDTVKFRQPYFRKDQSDEKSAYVWVQETDGTRRRLSSEEADGRENLPEGARLFRQSDLTSQTGVDKTKFPVFIDGREFRPNVGVWKTGNAGMERLLKAARVISLRTTLAYQRFFDDFAVSARMNLWTDASSSVGADKVYVVQTHPRIVERCILMATDPGDLVLDPTCGSGTTAYVAEQWGRRWITIDTSRVALALARARIMGARYPWYLLADSPEGQLKEAEITRTAPSTRPTRGSVRHGFVYERVPHITLKSIANNAEIDVIWEKWQQVLEPLRAQLNQSLGRHARESGHPEPTAQKLDSRPPPSRGQAPLGNDGLLAWEEWQIPRDADPDWPDAAKKLHADWWQARIARQQEIDASIAAKADSEYLYDKPYADNKRVRVAGPFTVESLSPHRVLGVDENDELIDPAEHIGEPGADYGGQPRDFVSIILENLRTAGVQQAHKTDKIDFISLVPWPGDLVCAEGRYVEGGGADGGQTEKRAAIFIGPEFGTVSRPDLVEAAREAADAGFDVLIACAFNFDAHAGEFAKLGRIPVLKARMNADLHMADDLKNTGKGNLFVIFGEPDIDILEAGDGQLQVKVNGVDVFDPSTGEVRSDGADGIACWFLDTDYNEESFFVRHAYFLGANDPYKALKTTLKAEIDEDAWATLNSDTSRPFDKPKSGRIAVKVINHLGDEVMKVFRV